MVERLSLGPASVKELARPFAMALPSVLKHLHVLRPALAISRRRPWGSRRGREGMSARSVSHGTFVIERMMHSSGTMSRERSWKTCGVPSGLSPPAMTIADPAPAERLWTEHLDRLVESVDLVRAEGLRVAPQMVDEGARHQERFAEALVQGRDAAREVHVAADHGEIEPLAGPDVAIGRIAVMKRDAERDGRRKAALLVCRVDPPSACVAAVSAD